VELYSTVLEQRISSFQFTVQFLTKHPYNSCTACRTRFDSKRITWGFQYTNPHYNLELLQWFHNFKNFLHNGTGATGTAGDQLGKLPCP